MKTSTIVGLSAIVLIVAVSVVSISRNYFTESPRKQNAEMPRPVEGEENARFRKLYNDLRHKAAPGIVWEDIERQNVVNNALQRQAGVNLVIPGTWAERGANNQAGSIRAIDYVPLTNTIYTISNGGSLWSSVLGSGSWVLQNQSARFDQRIVSAFTKVGGGERVLVSTNQNINYSDDNGQTFAPATGITYPVPWDGNSPANILRLNDGSNTIYCLSYQYSDVPFGPAYWLYRSTDQGQSFTKIYEWSQTSSGGLAICKPYNTDVIYTADISAVAGSIRLYATNGVTTTALNTASIGGTVNSCVLKGSFVGGVTVLYALINDNTIFTSSNLGASWTFRSTLPEAAWGKMNVSPLNASIVSYGGVNAFRSTNGGVNFTRVNNWSGYYGHELDSLHADIMEIEYFKRTDNSTFALINSHGGTYLSNDNLLTVINQSMNTHRATEYYDVLTDTVNLNRIFTGSQDQGLQRTLSGTTAGSQDFSQLISGDYGHISLTNNNTFLWPQYPGGHYYNFTDLGNPAPTYVGGPSGWLLPGTQKPNYGWMLAAKATANKAANEIWIGGGNVTGGGGSYLVKASMLTVAPFTVTATQFNYNFRTNSRTGTAGITAIEQSLISPEKLYCATEDGTFFYSNNSGLNWNSTSMFIGPYPWYLYGSCILASKINSNTIWYAGSGYSNPGVYKSIDGGVSFAPMAVGLPPTLVNEIVASTNEEYLFAATEAGPYVYIVADGQWYSMADVSAPVQFYSGVEFIRAENTVRFSTMGRGVWDFKLTGVVPLSLTRWNAVLQSAAVHCSWQTENEVNTSHFIVERSDNSNNFKNIGTQTATGNNSAANSYSFIDHHPLKGTNYYRLKMVDVNGKFTYSRIIPITLKEEGVYSIYPNPVKDIIYIRSGVAAGETMMQIYDASGRKIMEKRATLQRNGSIDIKTIPNGNYMIMFQNGKVKETLRFIKQ